MMLRNVEQKYNFFFTHKMLLKEKEEYFVNGDQDKDGHIVLGVDKKRKKPPSA